MNALASSVGSEMEFKIDTVRIPFDEVIPGTGWLDVYVRDDKQFVDVMHLIELVCDNPTLNQTNAYFQNVKPTLMKWGRAGNFQTLKLHRYDTEYGVTFPYAVRLLELLPNDAGRRYRAGLTGLLRRHYGGDVRDLDRAEAAGVARQREDDARPKPVMMEDVAPAAVSAAPVRPAIVLKDGQETVIKLVRVGSGEESDDSGDGWLGIRVVVRDGKEFVSTRDVIKHMIEKSGKPVAQMWAQVKAGKGAVFEGRIAAHKFKGSGEVEHDVIERGVAGELVTLLAGEAADRNRARMLAAIKGEAGAPAEKPVIAPTPLSKDELLAALDAVDPEWLEEVTGQPGAKRAKRV